MYIATLLGKRTIHHSRADWYDDRGILLNKIMSVCPAKRSAIRAVLTDVRRAGRMEQVLGLPRVLYAALDEGTRRRIRGLVARETQA